jgi:ATP/maltotriose-dependent transcriptional regulator MalT
MYHCELGMVHFEAGNWDEALAEAEVGLGIAEEVQTRIAVIFIHADVALIALHRGEHARAQQSIAALAGEPLESLLPCEQYVALGRALVAEADGKADVALATLSQGWDVTVALGPVIGFPMLGPDFVRLLVRSGDHERAAAVTADVQAAATTLAVAWAQTAALRCAGLSTGDPDVLLTAVDSARRASRPLDFALALEDAGTGLVRARQEPDGVALLEEALSVYERLGAARCYARVDAVLRSQGRGSRRRGWHQRKAKVGWDALTATERDVVRLVAEGLPNRDVAERLFISHRTVESHLSHVFGKLGLSSRNELRSAIP